MLLSVVDWRTWKARCRFLRLLFKELISTELIRPQNQFHQSLTAGGLFLLYWSPQLIMIYNFCSSFHFLTNQRFWMWLRSNEFPGPGSEGSKPMCSIMLENAPIIIKLLLDRWKFIQLFSSVVEHEINLLIYFIKCSFLVQHFVQLFKGDF